jgi:hypothetical protein
VGINDDSNLEVLVDLQPSATLLKMGDLADEPGSRSTLS